MSGPDFHAVKSSNIAAIAHHDGALHVRFNSGDTWSYPNVPADVFHEMKSADSVGKFFHGRIKGKFEGTKVQ